MTNQIRWVVSLKWPGGAQTFPIVGNPASAWGLIRRAPEEGDFMGLHEAMAFAEKLASWVTQAPTMRGVEVMVQPDRPMDGTSEEYFVCVERDWAPPEFWKGTTGESFTLHEDQAALVPKEAAETAAAAIRIACPECRVYVRRASKGTQPVS